MASIKLWKYLLVAHNLRVIVNGGTRVESIIIAWWYGIILPLSLTKDSYRAVDNPFLIYLDNAADRSVEGIMPYQKYPLLN